MARTAEGWKLVWRRGVARVRFTHAGGRYEITTGERDPGKAATVAARVYSDVIHGRVKRAEGGTLVHPTTPLEQLISDWLEAIEPELGVGTPGTYTVYGGHWVRHFDTVGQLTDARCADYVRERLRHVQASTVRKELSALRRFLGWLVERRMLALVPDVPSVPRKALGTKQEGRRGQSAELTLAEVERILAQLPETTKHRGAGQRAQNLPVRARFVFLFETALRPQSTVAQLRWGDVTAFGLHVRPECDKNRWERTVPLSERARAALDSLPRGEPGELVFGAHDLREAFESAVARAFGGQPPTGVTQYALKHARITAWFEEGATVPAVKFLTGITQTKTLDRYMRASRRAAEQLLSSGAIVGPQGERQSAKERT